MVVASAGGTATVGGFTGAGLLAGGCGIMWELNPNSSWWIHRCGLLAGGYGIVVQLNPQQQLVDSQVQDC